MPIRHIFIPKILSKDAKFFVSGVWNFKPADTLILHCEDGVFWYDKIVRRFYLIKPGHPFYNYKEL